MKRKKKYLRYFTALPIAFALTFTAIPNNPFVIESVIAAEKPVTVQYACTANRTNSGELPPDTGSWAFLSFGRVYDMKGKRTEGPYTLTFYEKYDSSHSNRVIYRLSETVELLEKNITWILQH